VEKVMFECDTFPNSSEHWSCGNAEWQTVSHVHQQWKSVYVGSAKRMTMTGDGDAWNQQHNDCVGKI